MGEVKAFLSLLLFVSFGLLSLLHFAWACGVKWGFNASLPTDLDGKRVLNPKKIDCAIVGLGLALFAIFYMSLAQQLRLTINAKVEDIVSWIIPSIFAIRAVGDFKYVGFFKKIRATQFGKLDTRIIIPLCLSIAIAGFMVAF